MGRTLEVRYWAGARAAAGVEHDRLEVDPGATVADVLAQAVGLRPALAPVVPACSVLVDGRSVPRDAEVGDASSLEVLPPFAGG